MVLRSAEVCPKQAGERSPQVSVKRVAPGHLGQNAAPVSSDCFAPFPATISASGIATVLLYVVRVNK
jgi:hypothetical protein